MAIKVNVFSELFTLRAIVLNFQVHFRKKIEEKKILVPDMRVNEAIPGRVKF